MSRRKNGVLQKPDNNFSMSNNSLRIHLDNLLARELNRDQFCATAVRLISEANPDYDWVGIYIAEEEALRVPDSYYVGPKTEHTVIPYNEGVCGASATHREMIVVDDVHHDSRYIACSIYTKSEIVVPIMQNGTLFGVLDLDSDVAAAFGKDDQKILQDAADRIAQYLAQLQ